MARERKPFHTPQDPRHRQAQREAEQQNAVVQHRAPFYLCGGDCRRLRLPMLDLDLLVHRLALEIWREHPDRAPALLEALEELLTERMRHRPILERIGQRLRSLADDPAFHIHLEPLEKYRALVRSRLFPQPPK
jgi:hypothetical protein